MKNNLIRKFNHFVVEKWGNQKHYIQDMDTYNVSMTTTLDDKIFFLNYVTPDVIVDFGCADGATLDKIRKINDNIKLVGYDLSETMLNKAKNKVPNAHFTSNWKEIEKIIKGYEKPLILLSSVIHEVYSYSIPTDIPKFWNKVFNGGFKYIAIRDMMPSSRLEKMSVSENEYNKVKNGINTDILQSFESHWGPINSNRRNFIHFLLKYRYDENWNRELIENYVPISRETLEKKIPIGWNKMFYESFTLPFLKRKIKEDFNLDFKDETHIKLLLER